MEIGTREQMAASYILTKPEIVILFLSPDTRLFLGMIARLLFTICLIISGVQELLS